MQNEIIPIEIIENRIFLIRGKKVMFDRDLARLYDVPTKVLNQSVSRNIARFPEDFMFQLTKNEMKIWKSQIVTSNSDIKGLRKNPYVFTEQGVAMLSSVLRSERAIRVNIQIMRTFTKIREMIINNKALREKIEAMERKYDKKFRVIFEVIKKLIDRDKIEPMNISGFQDRKKK
ncbi:MAG: ORF6N domain-containing protein [Patescibacteria group bacterium]|nr:ORF6N domain-containing protein [Patescibacteria group bacterium]